MAVPIPSPAPEPEVIQASLWNDAREIVHDYGASGDLITQLILRDVRIKYKQAVMGFGWAILTPLLVVGAGILVRLMVARASGQSLTADSIATLGVKSVPWAFVVASLSFASSSLTGNTNLVGKIYFAREVLPVSATLAQAIDALIGATAVLLLVLSLGLAPSIQWLWVIPLGLLLLLLSLALNLLVACANLFFRDVKYLVQVGTTFGIFLSPVLYDTSMLSPRASSVIMLNPISPILEGLRVAIVERHNLLVPLFRHLADGSTQLVWSPGWLGYAACVAAFGAVAVSLLFHRLEFLFAEYV